MNGRRGHLLFLNILQFVAGPFIFGVSLAFFFFLNEWDLLGRWDRVGTSVQLVHLVLHDSRGPAHVAQAFGHDVPLGGFGFSACDAAGNTHQLSYLTLIFWGGEGFMEGGRG